MYLPHQNLQPYAFPYSITHHRHGPVFLILKVGHLSSCQIMVGALPIMRDMPGVPNPQEMHKAGRARRSLLQLSTRPYHHQRTIFVFLIALLIHLHLVTTEAVVLPSALIPNLCYDLACLVALARLNLNVGSPVLPHYHRGSLVCRASNTRPHDAKF